jgi:hypothetical protein
LVSKSEVHDSADAGAPDKANRPFMALVLLFVVAFAAATAAQIKAHHDNAADMIVAAQASAAGLIAERVTANLAMAMGASASVAELARTQGAEAQAVAAPRRTQRPPGPPQSSVAAAASTRSPRRKRPRWSRRRCRELRQAFGSARRRWARCRARR